MGTPQWRVAIVGCGNIAGRKDYPRQGGPIGTHALAYYRHPRFALEVAVNPTLDHLKLFQNIWNIPRGYQNLADMLHNESVDVISLCTPNHCHAPQLLEIVESSCSTKVIFAEKPVCLNRAELIALEDLLNENRCLVMVNHSRRFDPGHIRLMEFVQNQELGDLLQGRCDYYGGWFNNGCHLIDTVRMLFKKESAIESVKLGAPVKANDPCLDLRLMVGDAPVDILSFDERYYQLYESEFRFENGRVLIRDFGTKIFIERVKLNELEERVLVPLPDSPWNGLESPIYYAIDLIAQYLDKGVSLAGRGVLIDEVAGTMNILWQAVENLKEKEGMS